MNRLVSAWNRKEIQLNWGNEIPPPLRCYEFLTILCISEMPQIMVTDKKLIQNIGHTYLLYWELRDKSVLYPENAVMAMLHNKKLLQDCGIQSRISLQALLSLL